MNSLIGLGFILIAFGLYWLPSIIAAVNHHAKRNSIMVINFFLGWTLIGWVVALAMSVDQSSWQAKPARYDAADPSTMWPPATPAELSAQRELPKFGPL